MCSVSNRYPESELHYQYRFTANQFVLATSPLRLTTGIFFFKLNTCGHSPYVTSALTREWVCRLQLLLTLTSSDILSSEFRRTHDHILLPQIVGSPNLECEVPVFITPKYRWPSYTSRHWVPFSSQGYGGGIRPRFRTGSRYPWSQRIRYIPLSLPPEQSNDFQLAVRLSHYILPLDKAAPNPRTPRFLRPPSRDYRYHIKYR
jgi:hypothetical protein